MLRPLLIRDARNNAVDVDTHGRKNTAASSCTYQCRLARALYAVQAYEERRRRLSLCPILLTVPLDALCNERYAVFRLVIDDLRHLRRSKSAREDEDSKVGVKLNYMPMSVQA